MKRAGRELAIAVAAAMAAATAGLAILVGAGSSDAANTPTSSDSPTERPSVSQWAGARAGGDQQAAEEANFDSYYQNPANSGPSSQGRTFDLADSALEMALDLRTAAALARDPAAAYTNNFLYQVQQFPFIAGASGSAIAPIPAAALATLNDFLSWVVAMPTTAAELAFNDPLTRQGEQVIQQRAPILAQALLEGAYSGEGQTSAQARTSAAIYIGSDRHGRVPAFTSPQVDALRVQFWQYRAVRTFRDGTRVTNSIIFQTLADDYNAAHHMAIQAITVRRAVFGLSTYESGRPDVNGVPFNPPPNYCPADYVCPPGPPPASQ